MHVHSEGLFVWAVYKIEVTHDDKEWSIYRRFSHFTSLQQELVKVYGEPYMAVSKSNECSYTNDHEHPKFSTRLI